MPLSSIEVTPSRLYLSLAHQAVAAFGRGHSRRTGNRLSRPFALHLPPVLRAPRPPGQCAERPGHRPGRHGGCHGRDSHRYLEAFFAVPMMGGVPQTVNVPLVAGADPVHLESCQGRHRAGQRRIHSRRWPIIKDQLETVKQFILISDDGATMSSFKVPYAGEYEALLAAGSGAVRFPDFDENTRATTFYTTGTTGLPRAFLQPSPTGVAHSGALPRRWAVLSGRAACIVTTCICRLRRCSMCTPGACPMSRPCLA